MSQTLGSLKDHLSQRLAPVTHSESQTRAEIRLIFDSLLNISWDVLYRTPDHPLSPHQWEQVENLLQKRVQQRIPLQYLLGEAYFYGLRFHVSPGVLIPRPETELLVEHALMLCRANGYQSVLDLGTGSGAIAIALAKNLSPSVSVTATDISPAALGVAKENAQTLGVNVRFYYGDLFDPVADQRFDLIISNPPYISPALRDTLAPEVRDHEPTEALFATNNGFAFYERIAQEAPAFLTAGGTVAVELGQGMEEPAKQIFEAQGFQQLTVIPDYAGIPRHLSGFWA